MYFTYKHLIFIALSFNFNLGTLMTPSYVFYSELLCLIFGSLEFGIILPICMKSASGVFIRDSSKSIHSLSILDPLTELIFLFMSVD